jgi:hypothetical protein
MGGKVGPGLRLRRSNVLANIRRFPLIFLAAACLVLGACGDDDDTGDADASTTPDASTTTPDASTTYPDAATADAADNGGDAGGVAGEVYCGSTAGNCTLPQVCCVTGFGENMSAECTAAGDCEGAAVACDGPEDCNTGGGEVCCGQIMSSTASCTTDSCMIVICHSVGDCPDATYECCPTDFGGGYCSQYGCI